ncbi:transglycosylase SLT domain-containing protein [Undibacterium sp.]|uniref:transglycosylase SLT domain-containing protein n=1 Tax=Undibacterium sp. TaxID=1914977 RepID=UPI0025FB54B7|nr:transglycosylase SLT domain-containing protein [Undibacterium sp.]
MDIFFRYRKHSSWIWIFVAQQFFLLEVWAFQEPVAQVSSEELTELARRYENAEGVSRDYQRAFDLYCQAAKAGWPEAQYALAWMYANARGLARNDQAAQQLFQLAAEQGHRQSMELIRGIERNDINALPSCLFFEEIVPTTNHKAISKYEYPQGKVSELVNRLAPRYAIDPALAMAIISVESHFNERAVSAKNAQGLMQLMPDTAERFGVKDAFNPEQNIKGGLAYLRWLLAFFRGNVSLVAAAYNSGERTVEKYHGVPPYQETIDYVQKVINLYQKITHPFLRNIASPPFFLTSKKL